MLNTERAAAPIERALSPAMTGEDRRFIRGVGADWNSFGLSKALFRLQNHVVVPRENVGARCRNPFSEAWSGSTLVVTGRPEPFETPLHESDTTHENRRY